MHVVAYIVYYCWEFYDTKGSQFASLCTPSVHDGHLGCPRFRLFQGKYIDV